MGTRTALLAASLLALTGCVGATGTLPDPVDYAADLLARTNQVRRERDLAELTGSACAAEQARARATALIGRDLEHADLAPVLESCAPPSGLAAENLSRTGAPPAEVVEAWLESPGHANNLLSPRLTAVGVACVPDPPDGTGLVCSELFLG